MGRPGISEQGTETRRNACGIAAEMGISVGNFYYHFKNKEDSIRALYV